MLGRQRLGQDDAAVRGRADAVADGRAPSRSSASATARSTSASFGGGSGPPASAVEQELRDRLHAGRPRHERDQRGHRAVVARVRRRTTGSAPGPSWRASGWRRRADQPFGTLSAGERRRVSIARALDARPGPAPARRAGGQPGPRRPRDAPRRPGAPRRGTAARRRSSSSRTTSRRSRPASTTPWCSPAAGRSRPGPIEEVVRADVLSAASGCRWSWSTATAGLGAARHGGRHASVTRRRARSVVTTTTDHRRAAVQPRTGHAVPRGRRPASPRPPSPSASRSCSPASCPARRRSSRPSARSSSTTSRPARRTSSSPCSGPTTSSPSSSSSSSSRSLIGAGLGHPGRGAAFAAAAAASSPSGSSAFLAALRDPLAIAGDRRGRRRRSRSASALWVLGWLHPGRRRDRGRRTAADARLVAPLVPAPRRRGRRSRRVVGGVAGRTLLERQRVAPSRGPSPIPPASETVAAARPGADLSTTVAGPHADRHAQRPLLPDRHRAPHPDASTRDLDPARSTASSIARRR